jgi:hypothetical protein
LSRKLAVLTAALLIAVIVLSLFLVFTFFSNQTEARPFYLGVEYAYGNNQTAQVQLSQIKALVDKVKDFTNLFVIGSVELTFNRPILDEACDYIYGANLSFIVLFTSSNLYTSSASVGFDENYTIFNWMSNASQKYGDKLLGIYRFDEPGGNQLDNTPSQFINITTAGANKTYDSVAISYVGNLTAHVNYYRDNGHVKLVTADYGLFWFDYKSRYNTIFAEFVGNQSRQRIIALERGAAQTFNKDWGVIINWKYNQEPYLESGPEMYSDLSLAYSSGAKYAIVFSYPTYPINNQYGTIQDKHFEALQKFWSTLHSNPASFGSNKPEATYIVPANYGFGFRSETDTIWGLFPADSLSHKIFDDINILSGKYGSHFDILYDEPDAIAQMLGNYTIIYYWNQTIS